MGDSPGYYFGSSGAWTRLLSELNALAPTDLPLVLLGPTRCGKSALAEWIHRRSGRAGALVEHSLGAVPDELLVSIFQGDVRGPFTGAIQSRPGLLEAAQEGTLLLDEMALATPLVQRLLLGLLEGKPFNPVGSVRASIVNVRFLFVMNVDPTTLQARGIWQEDFYYRLQGNYLCIPALRDRQIDILQLADMFLRTKLRALGRTWDAELSDDVGLIFLRHPWPGNIRQLQRPQLAGSIAWT